MNQKKYTIISIFLTLLCTFTPLQCTTVASTQAQQLSIGAEAALLMDATTKTVLYEKNGYEQLYPASITKLMTALLAIENLSPNEIITFSATAVNSIEPNSNHLWMCEDEQITVDQALHGLLLESANEVANGLGEAVSGSIEGFAKLMTERAHLLGAKNTHFVNPNGLHDPEHYTTAYDMALIASELTTNDYFLQIMKDTKYQIPPTNKQPEIRYLAQQHPMINPVKNPALFREDVIGGKTGYTDQARQTLVTMARRGDTNLVAVILKAEKNTVYQDTSTLLDYGFDTYTSTKLHAEGEIIKTLPVYSVKSGQAYLAANSGLSLSEDATVLINHLTDPKEIVPSFNIPESLLPSAQVGDQVGTVDFVLHSKILCTVPLVISTIEAQPEPKFSLTRKQHFIPTSMWILIGIAILVFLFICKYFIRKRNNYLKLKKLKKLFK